MPQAKQQYRAFRIYKTAQAKFNISASQLGQKFGDFFVYIESKKGNDMENVVIYTKEKKSSNRLFIAKNANINNNNSVVSLKLKNGSGYTFSKDSLKMVDYETMEIYQNLKSKSFSYQNIKEYWLKFSKIPKKKGKILFFIFISLIPIIALYIVSAFSIINPRYQKSYAYPALTVTTILLYVIATIIQKQGSIPLLIGSIISITIIGLILFQNKVAKYF
jgi:lipopolysaccharide export system permease protein